MINLYLEKKVSEKEGKAPFTYVRLLADFGYERVVLTMDKNIISQLLNCPVGDLYNYQKDKPILVATLSKIEDLKNKVGK